jgi:hypothetical protein
VSTNYPPGDLTEPPQLWQPVHHSVLRRKHWPIRHKIWTVILSVIGLFVILAPVTVPKWDRSSTIRATTPNATPAAPLKNVVARAGPAC